MEKVLMDIKKLSLILIAVFIIFPDSVDAQKKVLPENIKKKILIELGFVFPVEARILESDLWWGGGYRIEDDVWGMGFLIPNGYLGKVEELEEGKEKRTYYVIGKDIPQIRVEKDWPSNWLVFPVAKRTLKSIDYTNNWKEGVKEFWSFKFTYFLDPMLPELPRLGPFKGIGIAVWHPASGEWQLYYGSSLGDGRANEYNSWLTSKKEQYEKELEVRRKKEKEQAEAEMIKRLSQKYRDNRDGTVTDMTTGLVWTRKPVGYDYGLSRAKTACENLVIGSLNNWHLPTREELQTIIDKGKRTIMDDPDKKYFAEVVTDDKTILTSTEDAVSEYIWMWSLQERQWIEVNKEYAEDDYYKKFLCVHLYQEPSPPQTTEPSKLTAFITDQWKQVIQIPKPKQDWRELVTLKITGKYDDYSSLYLFGVNMRGRASDAFASADKFLKKGDLKNAQKYADLGTRYYIESENLFKASEEVFIGSVSMTAQVLEAAYRGPAEASKYGWGLMCGPKCYEVADYIFLMTDFAMDYGLEGMDEAKKNLIAKVFVKTLLKMGGISSWIENRTTHLIGGSGLYGLMDKTINSPEFQKAFMKALAESGAYSAKKLAEAGAQKVIQNSLEFVKGSSNLKPAN